MLRYLDFFHLLSQFFTVLPLYEYLSLKLVNLCLSELDDSLCGHASALRATPAADRALRLNHFSLERDDPKSVLLGRISLSVDSCSFVDTLAD